MAINKDIAALNARNAAFYDATGNERIRAGFEKQKENAARLNISTEAHKAKIQELASTLKALEAEAESKKAPSGAWPANLMRKIDALKLEKREHEQALTRG